MGLETRRGLRGWWEWNGEEDASNMKKGVGRQRRGGGGLQNDTNRLVRRGREGVGSQIVLIGSYAEEGRSEGLK